MSGAGTPVIGIAGWKNSGKTTLAVGLIEEFTRRGLRVATVKHAHHTFQIDTLDTDSARHRRAGAAQVAIVSSRRWALMTETAPADEPPLAEILAKLAPADLIVVEGYKRAVMPKIEVRRKGASQTEPLAPHDPNIVAIAADTPDAHAGMLPVFHLDDVSGLADFLTRTLRLISNA